MSALFKLKKTIGRTYDSDPDDTLKVKEALERLGYYETPDYGMTPHTDDQMFWAVEEFQRDFNLKVDGVVKPDNQTATYMGEVLNHKELIDEAKKSPPKSKSEIDRLEPTPQAKPDWTLRNTEKPGENRVAALPLALAPAIPGIVVEVAAFLGIAVAAAYRLWLSMTGEERRELRDKLKIGNAGSHRESKEFEEERRKKCEELHDRDMAKCSTLPDKQRRERCRSSAMERYSYCLRGKDMDYLPPLNTWD